MALSVVFFLSADTGAAPAADETSGRKTTTFPPAKFTSRDRVIVKGCAPEILLGFLARRFLLGSWCLGEKFLQFVNHRRRVSFGIEFDERGSPLEAEDQK